MRQVIIRQKTPLFNSNIKRRLHEGLSLLFVAIAVYLFLSLGSYHASDPGWSHTGTTINDIILNKGGRIGAWMADLGFFIFGQMAYLFPIFFLTNAWFLYREPEALEEEFSVQNISHGLLRYIGFFLALIAGCGLLQLHFSAGGILGRLTSESLINVLGLVGSNILLITATLIGITWLTGFSWIALIHWSVYASLWTLGKINQLFQYLKERIQSVSLRQIWNTIAQRNTEPRVLDNHHKIKEPAFKIINSSRLQGASSETLPIEDFEDKSAEKKSLFECNEQRLQDITALEKVTVSEPKKVKHSELLLPSLDLLDFPQKTMNHEVSQSKLDDLAREVEVKLGDFDIEGKVVAVHPGPIITRFEIELAPGIKVSKITPLAKDLARALSQTSVRIVEVIPGKSVIGLEIPNEVRELVYLKEILESSSYDDSPAPLSLALGKDISGYPVVVDLEKMPHLLVAGTTGSGKSVSLNAMIFSLLYKRTSEEVKLIMVDPKMLELSVYEGIPHLLTPVVTDMKEAANAFRWCVAEMDRRYRLMASLGVRNLQGYNTRVKSAIEKGSPLLDPLITEIPEGSEQPTLKPLPYIIVVVDELADMMMVVGKKVEELIARIAQKARAAGIHMILATQRPSVDVITGLIKANIPTRISFQVSSRVDSRTILDQQGAEQLLGYGDMLYLPPGTANPIRVHGAFVSDEEVHRVAEQLKSFGTPEYLESILKVEEGNSENGILGNGEGEDSDPLYDQAVQIILESRRPTISYLQRRLKIGYNRSARLLELMEMAGLVGPMESNGVREVLVPGRVGDGDAD